MPISLVKNGLGALAIFIVIAIICRMGLPLSVDTTNYLHFVLNTDFDGEFLARPYHQARRLAGEFELTQLIQGLPRIPTGW